MTRVGPCLDGMRSHHWRSAGLDVVNDQLREFEECPSCQQTRSKPYTGRPTR